jgi:hypothetical protein
MKIQSISIVVPTHGCVNKCKFCVSRMHNSPYINQFDEIAYRKRIKYASLNKVNTLILTGTGEALQNPTFLQELLVVLQKEHHPFPNVELQTTGVMLMNKKKKIPGSTIRTYDRYPNVDLLKELGVNTISLSLSDIFDSNNNWNIIGAPEKYRPSLIELCQFGVKHFDNLRLSLNMTNVYNEADPAEIINGCASLGANQITFRKLYSSGENEQSEWVENNACEDEVLTQLNDYIRDNGRPLYRLPFGPMVYSIKGMSVAVDDDCMNTELNDDTMKYVILRENGKLYCRWDDEGSLLF